jgi:predicted amidohydrolase YtcJ
MTLAGAYAGFEENEKGSIEVGKLADLTVLSQDLMTVEADRILDTVVSWTMVNGEVVYSRNATAAP